MKLFETQSLAREIRRLTRLDIESNAKHPIAQRLLRVHGCFYQGMEYLKIQMMIEALRRIERPEGAD